VKNSDGKSARFWEKTWKQALQKGECPLAGCDITKQTCTHLDRYLAFSKHKYPKDREANLRFTSDIDDFSLRAEKNTRPGQIWSLFKKLRAAGLERDQIGILLRKFGYGMTNRAIMKDMGWTSHDSLYRRYRKAMHTLTLRNLKEGEENGD
jgi:hypothetical protein